MKKILSIVAPMYNEEPLVEEYCNETLSALQPIQSIYDIEILFVNDGSCDRTYENMQRMQRLHPREISIVNLSRNFGLEGAVNAGIRLALGDAVVVMDADLQDPPRLILDMVKKWENGADIVVGSRIKRSHDGFFKKLGAGFYYHVLNDLSGKLKLEKSAANFRLLSRKALEAVIALPEVNTVFRVVVPFVGMRTDVVEYDRDKRFAGSTKYKLSSMIRYALDSVTGISIEPLRKILWMIPFLLCVCVLGFFSMFFLSEVWQVGCLLLVVLLIIAIVFLIVLALIGEYIGQIMLEVKGRPTSLIYNYLPCQRVQEEKK